MKLSRVQADRSVCAYEYILFVQAVAVLVRGERPVVHASVKQYRDFRNTKPENVCTLPMVTCSTTTAVLPPSLRVCHVR